MKISPDGKKIAVCHSQSNIELLDFDTTTGLVSNPLTLYNGNNYGVEFSPNSQVLYAPVGISSFGTIMQFDLTASNIVGSAQIVFNRLPFEIDALQLGPNNKIYMAQLNKTKLGVINNPNVIGLGCNTQLDAVDLAGRFCYAGLPPLHHLLFQRRFYRPKPLSWQQHPFFIKQFPTHKQYSLGFW